MTAVQEFVEYVESQLSVRNFSDRAARIYEELGEWDLSRALVLIETGNEDLVFHTTPDLAYRLGFEVPGYCPPEEEW